jgi:uncharacterized protein YdeI (YjbR/CyaY-like superfamily)
MPGASAPDPFPPLMKLTFFKTQADFRSWLEKHHDSWEEVWVGLYKKGSGKPSITWPESVDEALCFGWIDGIRKNVDEVTYTIRFTPRKPRSIWSAINIKRAHYLIENGLMHTAGLNAFEARTENWSGVYSYEQRPDRLPEQYEERFKRNKAAWEFYSAQRPSYRRMTTWWVVSAKKVETRLNRLDRLIDDSSNGRIIKEATVGKKSES